MRRLTTQAGARRRKADADTRPTVALFRLSGGDRPPMTEAVTVGHALRRTVQHWFGQVTEGGASPTFSGHDGDRQRTDQHRHAHYVSLPDPTGRRVDRLVVWAPEGFGGEEVAALARVRDVRVRLAGERTVTPTCLLGALGTHSELTLPELFGPALEWRSRTPFGLVRHPKRRRGRIVDGVEDQVRRELAFRGFPDPVAVTIEKGAWHRFRGSRLGTTQPGTTTLYGIRVRFAEPVHGPIAIGALSHFGLGVMRPVDGP